MIRQVLTRFRLVAPPGWAVLTFLLMFAVFEGPVLYFERQLAGALDLPIRPGRVLLFAASAALGIYRAIAFHPYFDREYLRWLKSTPWTVRKPLPVGPIELVPEDFLAVAALILLWSLDRQHDSIQVVNSFLFGHMVVLTTTFWRTEVPAFGYCTALFLGFVPQLWRHPWLDLAILVLIYLFAHEGLWRSLARFPWSAQGRRDAQNLARLRLKPTDAW
jgi:hypothetical protein